jgi:hypothetical protein
VDVKVGYISEFVESRITPIEIVQNQQTARRKKT